MVTHISDENIKLVRRKGAAKHNLLSKAICFNKNCRRYVGWRKKQMKRRFKGYKTPGIPKRTKPQEQIIVDESIINSNGSTTISNAGPTNKYDTVEKGTPTRFKNATFETNSYDLTPEFQAELKEFSEFLLSNLKVKVQITGHTDDVGSKEANQKLSEKRARAVADYLVLLGVASSRLTYQGKGDSEPAVKGADIYTAQVNRRVEFVITEIK